MLNTAERNLFFIIKHTDVWNGLV